MELGKVLTVDESKVLEALLQTGDTNPKIAKRLGMSLNTVNIHFKHIFQKTGYGNRMELGICMLHERYTKELDALHNRLSNKER